MKLGIFYSHPRIEEKALFAAAEADSDIELIKIKDSELIFDIHEASVFAQCDVVLLRSISHTKNYYAAQVIAAKGQLSDGSTAHAARAVNNFETIALCGDKFLTSSKLAESGIPTPKTKICFDADQALQTIDEWGYPVVLKPVIGSWGRLLSKINDRDAAETILEHKTVLGGIAHSNIFYVQEYIDKKTKRDIRAIVIGDEIVAAMYRSTEHWVTNTAQGATVKPCEITTELQELTLAAAKAVTNNTPALLGVDLIETTDGLKVIEVNSGVEWHGLIETTTVDLPAKILEFCKNIAK